MDQSKNQTDRSDSEVRLEAVVSKKTADEVYLALVNKYEKKLEENPNYDEDFYDEDEEEQRAEEEAEYAATCTCGAWVFDKKGKTHHIADCVCGAE